MQLIAIKGENMHGYIAFYAGKRIEIYADTLHQAKLKAAMELKVPKSKMHMISVVLAEKDGKAVVHSTSAI